MEERELNVSFYKAGNGIATRINLPKTWVNKLDITSEDRKVIVKFDEENEIITICKKK